MPYSGYDFNGVGVPPPMPENKKEGDYDIIPPLKPNSWVWLSVLVTLCCFPVFGIIGIVNGMQVNPHYYLGNYDRAERFSQRARMWSIIGLVVGVIYYVIMFVTMMKGDILNEITQMINDGAYSIYNY